MSTSIDMSKFKDVFVLEFEEHVQKLNAYLLLLEKDMSDQKVLDDLMRSAHTIKGSSAAMGYATTAFLTHVLEDVFDYARNKLVVMNARILDELFQCVDMLESSLTNIKKTGEEVDCTLMSKRIKKITGVETEGVGKSVRDVSGRPIANKSKRKSTKVTPDVPLAVVHNEELPIIEKITHVKVPVERIDHLMDLTEELLIEKMKLDQLKGTSHTLDSIIDHVNRLTADLQYQVMQTRLVPVGQVFARFPRMVRDLAHTYGKEVSFEITGSDLELDRTIVDSLPEPLIHLLRNAVDHGIGKEGWIRLTAKREREFALISVEDDGAGIAWHAIVAAAVKRGMMAREEGDALERAIQEFDTGLKEACIAEPGKTVDLTMVSAVPAGCVSLLYRGRLSTNDTVTETSGRGVGLSIVKNFTDQTSGRIIIESPIRGSFNAGSLRTSGTRFVLELPLTLAIINTLLVKVVDEIFAIPFSSIERLVTVSRKDIKSMADQDIAVIDGVDIPLARMERLMTFQGVASVRTSDTKSKNGTESKAGVSSKTTTETIVLVKRGRERAGVIVDLLVREQEVIVKPLPILLRHVKGFSGTTTLGDGSSVLIVDVGALLEDTRKLLRT